MIHLNVKTSTTKSCGSSTSESSESSDGISRRQAIQWVMAAVAASALPVRGAAPSNNEIKTLVTGTTQPVRVGYGTDPVLTKIYSPGDIWPLTFNEAQEKCAVALADVIIPADDHGPAASTVNVAAYINDWASAPYPQQQNDKGPIHNVLKWVDAESQKRFQKVFADASPEQQHQICDDICYEPKAKPEHKEAAQGFERFRNIAAAAYYATPAGWKAIGYVGNVALEKFDGPPAEVLEKLGVTQTVL